MIYIYHGTVAFSSQKYGKIYLDLPTKTIQNKWQQVIKTDTFVNLIYSGSQLHYATDWMAFYKASECYYIPLAQLIGGKDWSLEFTVALGFNPKLSYL